MENHLGHEKSLNHPKSSEKVQNTTRQSSKLGDRFKLDKLGSDVQQRKTEGVADYKQQGQKKGDEVVKYMSNLPSYLEKGEKQQEKAFNVGVLEWGRLEKWQHNNQRQLFRESSTYSPSSSNTSSNSSASHSSKHRTCTPGRLRTYHPPTRGINSSVTASSDDVVAIRSNYVTPEESKPKNHHRGTSDSKGKFKVENGDLLEEKLKDSNHHQQTVVLLKPKDKQEIKHPEASEQTNSRKKHGMDSLRAKQRTPFDHPSIEQPSPARVKDIRFPFETKRAIVLPRGNSVSPVRFRTAQDMSNKEFTDPTTVKVTRERALTHPHGNSNGPAKYKIPEDNSNKEHADSALVSRKEALVYPRVSPIRSKTPVDKLNNTITEPIEVKNQKIGCEVDNKTRNISPFRRFSFSSGLAQSSNNNHAEKSFPAPNTSCENSNANRKRTESPLKRLLDPFLKPRSENSYNSEPSVSRDGNGNVSNRLGESHALNLVKVKLDLGSCKEIDIDHPNDMDKHGSTTIQALLQVALKNGLPLFTFAVDNSNDILAATMTRLSSSKKDGYNWIFTFFTVHEMKKKNGSWLNYANKERKQGYIPNVVGQMKVSDVPNLDFIGKKSADIFRIREFVLLGVNLRHVDEKSSDFQANDELAAIVLKLPTLESNSPSKKDSSQKSDNLLGLTVILPGGQHGLPCNGRPSPLIERWRFGGSCDCGGWDLGCRLRVFTSEQSSSETALTSKKIHLYSRDHTIESKARVSLSPFKDGIYSVEFDSSLKLVQAFSICIAILNGLKPLEFLEMSSFFHKKSSLDEPDNTRSNNEEAKHPHIIDEEDIPACFVSCPQGTPADRV